ncbi:MAG: ATP-binding protein [Anaerolineae bacterium]|nr:ATP-binding protein [Anaerolineae bacterium]
MSAIEIGTIHDWQETKIWRELKDSKKEEAGDVCTTLQTLMPKIQTVLTYAGTSPIDFTLHDAQHSFRVAERMVDLIPKETFIHLSSYELAFLLLSAYLHDIGMSPKQQLVSSFYNLLSLGNKNTLTADQVESFEMWLGNYDPDVKIPTPDNQIITNIKAEQVSYIVSLYCRYQHVHWCGQWIDENINEYLGTYSQWTIDLKLLCYSHHQGYQELTDNMFNPKPVGRHGLIVHLRYLAAVLRIADILEFDPERTPAVIFNHRNINPNSSVYWHKDHSITLRISDRKITISSFPPNAQIHRAVETMINDIEEELTTIRRIDDNFPFEHAQFQDTPLYHKWIILPDVRRIIQPLNNSYEYIDGAFRPDTKKLLQLLSGTKLYKEPIVAIRELLQNALDAIREVSAYDRLRQSDPENLKWDEIYGKLHKVELSLEKNEGRYWLVCIDDGIGMSKRVLTEYLLVSGISRRRDVWRLERQCDEKGFKLGCTGQFGIGVLSYFMIADKVQIFTRRSTFAEDTDNTGWFFETEGIGSFGELRQVNDWRIGTMIRLQLKDDFIEYLLNKKREETGKKEVKQGDKVEIVYGEIYDYLRTVLLYLPCTLNFSLINNNQKVQTHFFSHGWVLEPNEYVKNEIKALSSEIFDEDERTEIIDCLNWSIYDGFLPENMGRYRVYLPAFSLSTGASHAFCKSISNNENYFLQKLINFGDYFYIPRPILISGWRGMQTSIQEKFEQIRFGIIIIDWDNSTVGELSVSRENLNLNKAALKTLEWLNSFIDDKIFEFAAENEKKSPFSAISFRLQNKYETPDNINSIWNQYNPIIKKAVWGKLNYPTTYIDFGDEELFGPTNVFSWNGKPIFNIVGIGFNSKYSFSREKISILNKDFAIPDKILALYFLGFYLPVPVWENQRGKSGNYFGEGFLCQFPPKWSHIAYVETDFIAGSNELILWNQDHALGKIKRTETFEWLKDIDFSLDDEEKMKEIIKERDKVLSFLGMLIQDINEYQVILDNKPKFLMDLWDITFEQDLPEQIVSLSGSEILSFTPTSAKKITLFRSDNYLPDPGKDWLISLESE